MNDGATPIKSRAAELRCSFDQAFSRLPGAETERSVDLLSIRVSGDPWALRLSEVAGLFAGRRITPAPSGVPNMLGLVGLRGGVHPVYSLRGLLGYPPGDLPRWMVLVGASDPVALAFDVYEGHQSVPAGHLVPAPEGSRAHAREVVRGLDAPRSVLAISSITEAIKRRSRPAPVHGELTHES